MTPTQYNFLKNFRLVTIVAAVAFLIFMAGALFTGYKLTLSNYAVLVIIVVNLINSIINKPTPSYEQVPGKTPETK